MTILDELAQSAYNRVTEAKKKVSADQIKAEAFALPKGDFEFEKALNTDDIAFICECEKASPSKGLIAEKFPYLNIARQYEKSRGRLHFGFD